MDLGSFSISLGVKDIGASLTFYQNLGCEILDGRAEDRCLMLKNGDAKIGLFQGMFEGNVLTFNPADVGSIQKHLEDQGVALLSRAKGESDPAAITLEDPDRNHILMNQF